MIASYPLLSQLLGQSTLGSATSMNKSACVTMASHHHQSSAVVALIVPRQKDLCKMAFANENRPIPAIVLVARIVKVETPTTIQACRMGTVFRVIGILSYLVEAFGRKSPTVEYWES